ncbi:multicopper oxidase domain-containing protein [Thorsellia anophelis]|uniref:multicopper oxidase domain-containing protein n=1 Tax=Thorsellia anophelis TaxID=336804 RepID=UPI000B8A2C36|nr:multicopper oxidase domain-containing protein [Thorsellia anophelis]
MEVTRRTFLKASLIGTGAALFPGKLLAQKPEQTKLPIPPLVESKRGQPIFLTMQEVNRSFIDNLKTTVWGFNGLFLGPTVRVKNGDNTKIIYSNRLKEAVAINIQGLHIPSNLMGGSQHMIESNATWSPIIPIRQYYSVCAYQAVTPNLNGMHIYNGLTGLWYVEDEYSKDFDLPNEYGVDDIPLIIQDMRFNSNGNIVFDAEQENGFLGDRLIVNGVISPVLDVPKKLIRLRLYNASNSRRYQVKLSTGETFYVIGSEQGLLPSPIIVPTFSLAPGERREMIIDMSNQSTVSIVVGQDLGIWARTKRIFESSNDLISSTVLTLNSIGEKSLVPSVLPSTLVAQPVVQGQIIKVRELLLNNDPPGINHNKFDPMRVDMYAKVGTWERWILTAILPQSFTLQGAVFLVSSVNGAPPLPEDRGLCDTVWVDGTIELFVFFTHVSTPQIPFLVGSRNLTLRDSGALAQLVVDA